MDNEVLVGPSRRNSHSDEWDNISHLQNNVSSADHHPFSGDKISMLGFDPNHLGSRAPRAPCSG
eukprot:4874487-Pleurochrysis_carterae.AAC.3